MAHAYLFSGPQGSGKGRLALEMAKAVLCRSHVDGDACGTCSSCRLAGQGTHPDIEFFRPEDGRTSYPVRQLREDIRRRAYLAPSCGPKRFLVIEQAEALVKPTGARNEGADTLLKLLEEPARDTVLILLATRPERLPDTVVSRCQHVRLRPPGPDRVAQVLSAETGLARDEVLFLAHLSGGDVPAALGFLRGKKKDRPDLTALRSALLSLARDLGRMTYPELFAAAAALEGYSRGWPVLTGALGVLAALYRDAALKGAGVPDEVLHFTLGPEAALTRDLAATCGPGLLGSLASRVLRAQDEARRYPARLLFLEVLFLDLREMYENAPVQ
jgi:DNA polymerase-3 subunit delta'